MLTLVAQNSKPTYAFGADKGEPIASLYRKSVPITRYTEQAPFASDRLFALGPAIFQRVQQNSLLLAVLKLMFC